MICRNGHDTGRYACGDCKGCVRQRYLKQKALGLRKLYAYGRAERRANTPRHLTRKEYMRWLST